MGKKHPGGRPLKLTPELQANIVDLVKRGNYLDTAAMHAGVARSTLSKWMSKGRKAKSGIYYEFLQAVNRAATVPEVSDMEVVRKAAASDWRAAAWRLEHRYPQRFSRKTTNQRISGPKGKPLAGGHSTLIVMPDNGRIPLPELAPAKGKAGQGGDGA